MNIKQIAGLFGIVVLSLGVLGLASGEQQLAQVMNVDLMLDIARIGLAAYLIYGSLTSERIARSALFVLGIVYLANFGLAMVSPDAYGLLPHMYGAADNLLHGVGGIAALIAAVWKPITNTQRISHA